MNSSLVDLVKLSTSTTGTGTITLGTAVDGYQGASVLTDGSQYSYSISDGTSFEIGTGTYASSGTTLTRTPIASTAGAATALDLSGSATVAFTALSADLGRAPIVFEISSSAYIPFPPDLRDESVVQITLIGSGGGGEGGVVGVQQNGGCGGEPGAIDTYTLPGAFIKLTVDAGKQWFANIGAGGVGGAAGTDTTFHQGASGNDTHIDVDYPSPITFRAKGAAASGSGGSPAAYGGSGGQWFGFAFSGSPGTNPGWNNNYNGYQHIQGLPWKIGGGGGGCSGEDGPTSGSAGGGNDGNLGGRGYNSRGGDGVDNLFDPWDIGTAGGGGAGNQSVDAFDGGDGYRGAGGGGGGSSELGAAGKGGDGGDGLVLVKIWL